jgi:hypothetical protein
MTLATSLDLDDRERERVEQLCGEFDPEKFVPEWMMQRGERADWEGFLRFEREEFRRQLEVAVSFGRSLQRLANTDFRFELFCNIASEVTKFGSNADYLSVHRCYQLFEKEDSDRLFNAMGDACEAACRRALSIDSDPQAVPAG